MNTGANTVANYLHSVCMSVTECYMKCMRTMNRRYIVTNRNITINTHDDIGTFISVEDFSVLKHRPEQFVDNYGNEYVLAKKELRGCEKIKTTVMATQFRLLHDGAATISLPRSQKLLIDQSGNEWLITKL